MRNVAMTLLRRSASKRDFRGSSPSLNSLLSRNLEYAAVSKLRSHAQSPNFVSRTPMVVAKSLEDTHNDPLLSLPVISKTMKWRLRS